MASLPHIGHLEYNGYKFPSLVKVSCVARRIPDSSDRTTKCVQYTIKAEAEITTQSPSESSDILVGIKSYMEDIRTKLLETGKPLIFLNFGFSDLLVNLKPYTSYITSVNGTSLDINNSFSQMDVSFGPKPQVLEWTPLGSNLAALIKWECVTEVPECATTASETGNPIVWSGIEGTPLTVMSFNFDVGWKVNSLGLTTRTIRIDAEIPLNRDYTNEGTSQERVLKDSADRIINRIKIPKIPGYSRDSSIQIDKSKQLINIVITDSILPSDNPYLIGCVAIDLQHNVNTNLHAAHNLWKNTLSGTITLAPGVQKWVAWAAFAAVLTDRLNQAKKGKYYPKENSDSDDEQEKEGGLKWITNFSVTEEIFGRSMTFSVSWELLTNIKQIFKASGLMKPVDPTGVEALGLYPQYSYGWESWSEWYENYAKLRGIDNLHFDPHQDIIVDFCQLDAQGIQPLPGESLSDLRSLLESFGFEVSALKCPEPKDSWMSYENKFKFESKDKALSVQTAYVDPATSSTSMSSGPQTTFLNEGNPQTVELMPRTSHNTGVGNSDRVQYVNKTQNHKVFMMGSAKRVGYTINPPNLLTFAGHKVKELGRNINLDTIDGPGACVIHKIIWVISYEIEPEGPSLTSGEFHVNKENTIINSTVPAGLKAKGGAFSKNGLG